MISSLLPAVVSLFVFTTLCNALCEEYYEDVLNVECTYSELTDVPALEIPHDVQYLDLSNNKLTKLKRPDWKDYNYLENLYLTGNEISTIESNAFLDLKNLRNIDLSNNRLRYIPPDIFSDNSLLQTVNFRGNSELYLPPDSHFLASESLTSLDLSYCRLTSLNPQTFSKMPRLVHLDVRYNNLTTVSLKTFDYLKDLNALNLRNNKWKCDCGIVDVLSWLSERRRALGLHREHSPVKCLDKGKYRILWSAASLGKQCEVRDIEVDSRTTVIYVEERQMTERPVALIEINTNLQRMAEQDHTVTTARLTTDTPIASISGNVEVTVIRHTPMDHPNSENPETLKPETPPISKQERPILWDEFKWNMLVLILFVTAMMTSVFVALVAVHRCTSWLESRSVRNNARTTIIYSEDPLMSSSTGNSLRSLPESCNSTNHVYEQIN